MEDTEQALKDLKDKIKTLETKKIRAETVVEETLKALKKNYGCSTLREAKAKVRELRKNKEALKEEIEAGIATIEKNFDVELS